MLKNLQPASRTRLWALSGLVCAAALALDLWTKQWAWEVLRPPAGRPWPLWPPTLELEFAFNRGSAFGVIERVDPVFAALTTAAVLGVWVAFMIRAPGADRARFVGAGLAIAGGLGNLHDRLFRVDALGHPGVVDFIKVNYPWGGSWPSFNVADIVLVLGALALVWSFRDAPGPKDMPART